MILSLFPEFDFCCVMFDPNKTHTRKFLGSTGPLGSVPPAVLCVVLDRLGHEAAHPLGGILLHFIGHVGVGVQGETRRVVT